MAQQEAIVIGASRRVGISKNSGNPYDMAMVLIAAPMQSSQKTGNNFTAFGYQQKEVDATEEAVEAIGRVAQRLPARLVLNVEAEIDERGNARAVCTGLAQAAAAKAS